MLKKINAAILGCTGYTGIELINILNYHPNVNINFIGSRSSIGSKINSFDKRLENVSLPIIDDFNNIDYAKFDVVFFTLPHSVSQNIIKDNFGKSIFIDLSADFRIKDYKILEKNYNLKHKCPFLIKEFVYGLPEINYEKISNSKNIAVPGCYPTSILLPLIPLLKNNMILTNNIIIDSKSGYSGAGKKFELNNLIKENNFNFYNYNTNNHRHICEVYQELSIYTKNKVQFSFNPHILPIFRGMMSTIYCDLNTGFNSNDIMDIYKNEYDNKIFINLIKNKKQIDFFSVIQTNKCLIKLFKHHSNDKIIIVSVIDNLIKGASGQAVQCMNLIFGLDEFIGLT